MIHHNKISIDSFRLLKKNSSILQLREQDSNAMEEIEVTPSAVRLTRARNLFTDQNGYNYDLIFLKNEFFKEESFTYSGIYRENTPKAVPYKIQIDKENIKKLKQIIKEWELDHSVLIKK